MGGSHARDGAEMDNPGEYRMGDVSGLKKGVRETYASISPSESQAQIIGGAKTEAYVTTSMVGRKSASESDDLDLQSTKVTIDVHMSIV